ncbi:MAG: hypothetical protein LC624_00665, partial [Halobacteriales archaeon]|nr:hypothetical protein [Halobacteriales archaeon]
TGACEVHVDAGRGAVGLKPLTEPAPDAWPVRDGAVLCKEAAKVLGAGPATARWSDRLGMLVVTRGL